MGLKAAHKYRIKAQKKFSPWGGKLQKYSTVQYKHQAVQLAANLEATIKKIKKERGVRKNEIKV